jgi:hypothetical protein
MTWGKVSLEIWTHKIDGLTESDFILAAKFDEVPVPNQDRPASRGGDDDSDDGDDDASDAYDDGSGVADDNEEEFDEAERE